MFIPSFSYLSPPGSWFSSHLRINTECTTIRSSQEALLMVSTRHFGFESPLLQVRRFPCCCGNVQPSPASNRAANHEILSFVLLCGRERDGNFPRRRGQNVQSLGPCHAAHLSSLLIQTLVLTSIFLTSPSCFPYGITADY